MAKEHDIDCPLYPQHWLRHALAAVERLVSGDDQESRDADRLSAASLLNTLDHYTKATGWAGVTLVNVAEYATLMTEEKFGPCDCQGPSQLRW